MIRTVDLRISKNARLRTAALFRPDPAVERSVARIIRTVRVRGDKALTDFTRLYDGVRIVSIAVPPKEISAAKRAADPAFVSLLKSAAANIRRYHRHQVRKEWRITDVTGSDLRQRYIPLDRVGVYVPGGTAAYPSTVLMNVVPAQVAGVKEIHLVSPPLKDGSVHPDVLTAAAVLGVSNVYRVGGAQAVAALAYGTATIPAVDKIVGPGNIFVATAKRMVYGAVGIDAIAGPSEVVVLADNSADPLFVAADLLAQAEHDRRAVPILVTPSASFAAAVADRLKRLAVSQPRRDIAAAALRDQGRIFLVSSLRHGIDLVNELAPEHLEIITTKDEEVLKQVRHAGSIFLGNHSPVAVGDYFAGPNHVLPTERTARFSSPLSVDDFVRRSSVVRFTPKKMRSIAAQAAMFADHEGLAAHAASLRLRGITE